MRKILLVVLVIVFVTGCNEQSPTVYAPNDKELSDELEQIVAKEQGIQHAQIVTTEKFIAISVAVLPWQRHKKKKIEKSLSKKVEANFTQYDVIVSSDLKLQFELEKIIKRNEAPTDSELKKLQKLLKEET